LLFKAKGASWVEVVDGTGTIQLRRILADGETVAISGALPLAVVVGRVDAVSLEVRGKAFDLASISKDGVARFEVK
jgi:cytoskeleton protein RodZ